MAVEELLHRVDSRIDARWNEQIAFLEALVAAPSTRGIEAAAQDRVAAELDRMGLAPDVWDVDVTAIADHRGYSTLAGSYEGRPNVTCRWPSPTGAGRSLILNGHIDVVPLGPEHLWTVDPYGAEIRDGKMFGRGAADMKSGITAMAYAVRALREEGATLAGDVILESVIEEECTGNGTLATLERGIRADAAIIPEPFDQSVLVAQVGVMWARVTVQGAGAHVLGAERAANAFVKAQPVVRAIAELEREVNAAERHAAFADHPHPLNFNVGVVRAGDWPSSVPPECTLEVRISAYPGADLQAVEERFRAHVQGAAAVDPWLAEHPPEVQFFGFRAEGCVIAADEPLLDVVAAAHRSVAGTPPDTYASTATTDARFFALYEGIPVTCYGPVGGNLHAPDEWVDLASVRATTKVLARAIVDWCGVL